jgi:hypothetical protein
LILDGAFLEHRARFSVVTLPADWMILPRMEERALIRPAEITLRRAILQNFPPGPERRAWLRWAASVRERGLLSLA